MKFSPRLLEQLRRDNFLTQTDLALAMKEKDSTCKPSKVIVSYWENGKTNPSFKNIKILAKVFDIKPTDLMEK